MTNEPPTETYADAFLTERPRDGLDIVHARLRKALKLNEELAEYFKERAQVEDLYAKSIAKLSKKHFVSDKSDLGLFLPVWELLHNEITVAHTIHSVMSFKIIEEIEQPLRASIHDDPNYAAVKQSDLNLQRIAKEYDERYAKMQKHKKSSEKSPNSQKQTEAEQKLAKASKQFAETRAQWSQDGPEYIQKHQLLDEHRWHTIQSLVEKFERLQNDQLLGRIQHGSQVLAEVAKFNVADEIAVFCASKPSNIAPFKASMDTVNADSAGTPSLLAELAAPARSIRSVDSSGPVAGVSPAPTFSEESQRPSLKKKDRKFLPSFVSMRRKPKTSENGYVNADLAAIPSYHDDNETRSVSADSDGRLSAEPSSNHQESKGNNLLTLAKDSKESDASPSQTPALVPVPVLAPTPTPASSSSPTPAQTAAPLSPTSLNPPTLKKEPSFSGSFTNSIPSYSQQNKSVVDADGYTIPPADRTAWPVEIAGSMVADDDFGSDTGSTFSTQPKLKIDIKEEATLQDDATNAAVALTRVSSLLKEKSTVSPGKRRGRREVRGTRLLDPVQEQQGVQQPLTKDSQQAGIAYPPPENLQSPGISLNALESPDESSTSITAKTSTDITAPSSALPIDENPTTSPFNDAFVTNVTQPTISISTANAEIKVYVTETVHALLKAGEVVQSTVWGEVKIAYDGPVESSEPICLKLGGTESLDHINVNETYLTYFDEKDATVLRLDTGMFHLAGDSPMTCLKYQVKKEADQHLVPITAKPMWKCEANQTLLLVKYSENQRLPNLDGVFFMTSVSGNVQQVQSIPAGQWMVDKERMVWPIRDIGEGEKVLRAKFLTKEQGTPQPLAIRFEARDCLYSKFTIQEGTQTDVVWATISSLQKNVRSGKFVAE